MKITGKDGKEYSTVDECIKADEEFDAQQEQNKLAEIEKKTALSKKKKEMADAIQVAEDEVSLALTDYDKAKEKANTLISEAKEEAKGILKEAAKKYDEAINKRYEALKKFNEEFGAYTTTYTGKRAQEEYDRAMRKLDRWFNNFFFPFVW